MKESTHPRETRLLHRPLVMPFPRQLPSEVSASLVMSTLPKLGGLRAISAFLVIAYHYGINYIPAGWGVLMFFVISGFLRLWRMGNAGYPFKAGHSMASSS